MSSANLYTPLPDARREEVFTDLLTYNGLKIERIVSQGQNTQDGEWYDQHQHEWVLLLQGAARLEFADGTEISLGPGDHMNIPAHCRHRVSWTTPEQPTIWLAVFYGHEAMS